MDKNKRIITVLMILTIVFTITGGTLAYWAWRTTDAQKTNITFTSTSDFSCSADGGGNITSGSVKLVPTVVSNTTTANYIKREVKVTPTTGKTIHMDLWLDIITLDSGLSNSVNFRYAFTTSSTSNTEGVVSSGNFYGKVANDKVILLRSKDYTSSTTETYYLWIWLDAAETDSATMNQNFNMKLGGECTDAVSRELYTANIYDSGIVDNNLVYIGQKLSNNIATYNTPDEAMNALKTAGGGTKNYPFFLKHTIADGSLWYATNSVQGLKGGGTMSSYPLCIYETSSECNSKISDSYVCKENAFTQGVLESYVGFVVTAEMATANPGMVAGTYYLKGGDDGKALLDNAKIMYDAFGGVGCSLDGTSGGNPYTTTPSSDFDCSVSGLEAIAYSHGYVGATVDSYSLCYVNPGGSSACDVSTSSDK